MLHDVRPFCNKNRTFCGIIKAVLMFYSHLAPILRHKFFFKLVVSVFHNGLTNVGCEPFEEADIVD